MLTGHQFITLKTDKGKESSHFSYRIVLQGNKIADQENFFFMERYLIHVEEITEFLNACFVALKEIMDL